jgi:hypothetical protein
MSRSDQVSREPNSRQRAGSKNSPKEKRALEEEISARDKNANKIKKQLTERISRAEMAVETG